MHVLYEQNVKEAVYTDEEIEKVCNAMQILSHNIRTVGIKTTSTSIQEKACEIVCKLVNIRIEEYEVKESRVQNMLKMDIAVMKAVLDGEVSLYDEVKCVTAQGKRLMLVFARMPLACKDEIERRHNIVDAMQHDTDIVIKRMQKVPDILVVCKRLDKGRVGVQDIKKIYEAVKAAKHMVDITASIQSMSNKQSVLHTSAAKK